MTQTEAVNQAVADMGINASISSLPESHAKESVDQTTTDLAAEAEATQTTSTN
jgi:hypothetical protein